MTAAQVVETSVSVNNNSPIQDYVHPDDQTQPTIYFVTLARFFVILIYPHSLFSYFCFWALYQESDLSHSLTIAYHNNFSAL